MRGGGGQEEDDKDEDVIVISIVAITNYAVTSSQHCMTTPARTPRLYSYEGTIFSQISSLHNSMHPRKMEINPPKTVCGYPCGGVIKTVTRAILSPY